jgi:cell division protein FtsL
MLRGLNLLAVGGLVAAAVVVYDVKYSATYEAQKVARLNNEIGLERETIAALKAEWSVLSAPDRIQRLASKYLGMKPLPVSHIGGFASLPERIQISGDPIGDIINSLDKNGEHDPIGRIIVKLESVRRDEPETTGSIKAPEPSEAEPIGATELPEPTGNIGGGDEEPEPAQ